ncbi:MAG: DNA repair protein RecO [Bacillati bacterium ANGP1]|uniref:DNA repair protein RecO n=1 Tax=Candidatus Segetimicrobium genomatis TaxID=2569760 RepID=A0A537K5P8_9BACT|nr:MAG: DNA repair protein RecO [Terrabacteria group bacterium ANGP1]
MPVYKTEAIVLRQQALGEADRIVTLFTREYGKLRAAAKGIRRPASRLAGRLEPFTHARLLLARGRTLDVIAQAEIVEAFAGVRADLIRSAYAAYVAELVDRGLADRDPHQEVFALTLDALEALGRSREDDADVAVLHFALRLAGCLGYQPETAACVECGRRLPRARGAAEAWAFSPARGGALCPACRREDAEAVPVAPGLLAAFDHLIRTSGPESSRLRMTPVQRGDLARLVQLHLEHRWEARLRAPLVIKRLREPVRTPLKDHGGGDGAIAEGRVRVARLADATEGSRRG